MSGVAGLWRPPLDEKCSACGHTLRQHENGIGRCEKDVPGIVGVRVCTCTFVRVESRCKARYGSDQCIRYQGHTREPHETNWGGAKLTWYDDDSKVAHPDPRHSILYG